MLSRRSPSRSQVGSSCAAPAADSDAPGRARLEQSCRVPEPRRAPRTAGWSCSRSDIFGLPDLTESLLVINKQDFVGKGNLPSELRTKDLGKLNHLSLS
ncbi:hypothetical protein R6Z07F_007624 [Ovis aries]